MSDKSDRVDKAMDDLLKAAPTKRPDEIKGPARVLKAEDLRNFIRGIVESVAGKSQAELITRLSEAEMALAPLRAEVEALRAKVAEQEKHLEASERRGAAAQADALAAREEAGRSKGDVEALRAELDLARSEAASMAERVKALDRHGDKASLAAEVARLREEIARLERALEFADLEPDVAFADAVARARKGLDTLQKATGSVPVDRRRMEELGNYLVGALSEMEAAAKELRAELDAARGTVGVIVRLAGVSGRGDALAQCARGFEGALAGAKG